MGPLLQKRSAEGKKAPWKSRTIPGGFDRKATVAAVMIVAAALFGVESSRQREERHPQPGDSDHDGDMGAQQTCRAKEVGFALLLPWHKVAPSMVVPYKRMCRLAQIARSPGTAQTVTQAIWEHTERPKAIELLGRALHEFRRLG